MKTPQESIRLVPMTEEMYFSFFAEYENAPELCLPGQAYERYEFSEEKVRRYARRQRDLGRVPLAVFCGEELVGEIVFKNIEPHVSVTMSVALKNARYKDRGIGTAAERLAVEYAFTVLDVPTVFADAVQSNTRSQRVLEKVGFTLIREDNDFRYYSIDRE